MVLSFIFTTMMRNFTPPDVNELLLLAFFQASEYIYRVYFILYIPFYITKVLVVVAQ